MKFIVSSILMLSVRGSYQLLTCNKCLVDPRFDKICNLGDNVSAISPQTSPYKGACCTENDQSKYCQEGQTGGFKSN